MNKRQLTKLTEQARSISSTIEGRDFRHVSMILRKGIVIAVGVNEKKTHPLAKIHGYQFEDRHSELDAFIRVPSGTRDKLTLVNFRFNNRGELRMSKPCKKCMAWCCSIFDRIYYSTSENSFHKV